MSLFDDATLAVDAALSAVESRMPEQGKAVKNPSTQLTAYDGKRALAKSEISKQLRKRGIHPDGLMTPSQLKHAAVLKELALIFRDMGAKNDSISFDKAKYYDQEFESELASLTLDYDASLIPSGGNPTAHVITGIPCYRV